MSERESARGLFRARTYSVLFAEPVLHFCQRFPSRCPSAICSGVEAITQLGYRVPGSCSLQRYLPRVNFHGLVLEEAARFAKRLGGSNGLAASSCEWWNAEFTGGGWAYKNY